MEEPIMIGTVTCQTTDCENRGVTFTVPDSDMYVCGVCDADLALTPFETEDA